MTFYGHKNQWYGASFSIRYSLTPLFRSSFFLIGFYTASLTTLILILRFGVLQGVKPPTTKLEGIFLLVSAIAGFLGGVGFAFFWTITRYILGGWGGFAFALWIQSFHSNGLIQPMLGRWGLYISAAVMAFCLCTIPKIQLPIFLASNAIVGSTAFMLGVDCFTTAGMKEFYLSNLGFGKLFPVFNGGFPVSQVMTIEIALVGAIALMGAAVQFRFLDVLRRRMAELQKVEQEKEMEQEKERQREEMAGKRFEVLTSDRDLWEREHGDAIVRIEDLEKGMGKSPKPSPDISWPSLVIAAGPAVVLAEGQKLSDSPMEGTPESETQLKYLEEIRQVRESISAVCSSSSSPRLLIAPEHLRTKSASSIPLSYLLTRPQATQTLDRRRTRSLDANIVLGAWAGPLDLRKTLKPPEDPEKMHWDEYTQKRRLFTPPSGATARFVVPASPAVAEALERRRMRESIILSPQYPEVFRRTSEMAPSPAFLERRGNKDQKIPSKRPQSFSGIRQSFTDARQSFRVVPDFTSKRQSSSSKPAPVREVTLGELDARHKEKIRRLQESTMSVERERLEVDQAQAHWDRTTTLERKEIKGRRKSVELDDERRTNAKVDDWQRRQKRRNRGAVDEFREASSPKDQMVPRGRPSSREAEVPKTQASGRHEIRRSSQGLDAWNMLTRSGMTSRPPPN